MIRPLYKSVEPFMHVSIGHGFLGVVMYDDTEDKVQCHICGKFFDHLGKHVSKHELTARNYKEQFGLTLRTPLCNKRYSNLKSLTMSKNIRLGKTSGCGPVGMSSAWIHRRKKYVSGMKKMTVLNRHGLCDLQIKARYAVVQDICKRMPKEPELRHYDQKLWAALVRRFGSINKARIWLGHHTMEKNDWKKIPDISIIAELRRFAKDNKRTPTAWEYHEGKGNISHSTILRRFGSWRNALRTAGLK